MVAEGLSYSKAVELIRALKENGIEANITVGGVRLNPKLSDIKKAKEICGEFGVAALDSNTTTLQEFTMLRLNNETT